MKILPIACDSLGTRSMCTFVSTKDTTIILDPSVSLAPTRYNLPPHPFELKRMDEHWKDVVKHAKLSDIIVITHYHYDHHNPEDCLDIYKGKIVFVKHPTESINKSQNKRANYFLKKIEGLAKEIIFSDGKSLSFGTTTITFSPPVFHGTDSKLGYVTEVLIDDGQRFIFTSDVEGPAIQEQLDFILKNKPNIVLIDGPLSSMLGFKYSQANLDASNKNIIRIINECPIECLIIDHHLLRDLKWRERIASVFAESQKKGTRVISAAEFSGKAIDILEAKRRELYKDHPA
jgi:predicted metallo-beta-lactamase superfamily hydrolase